jgi:TolA-binding protein
MSSVEPPSDSGAPTEPLPPAPAEDEAGRKKPTVWIVLTCLFAAAAIGLGIWAGTLQADLNDKDDEIAALERQVRDAGSNDEEAASQIADLEQQVAELEATVEEQQAALEGSSAETEQALKDAQAQVDAANAELGATNEALAQPQADL